MSKKAYIPVFALLLSCFCIEAGAQKQSYKGSMVVTPVRLEQLGDSLYVNMDIVLSDMKVRSRLSVELTPWLTSAGGSKSSLPVIVVKGRSNYKAYERSVAMDTAAGPFYTVFKGYGKNDTVIHYNYTVAYAQWMAGAALNLTREDFGCGASSMMNVMQIADHVKLEEKPEPPVIDLIPRLAFVTPEAEAVKTREIQAECRLDFIVNRTDINPSYMNNPSELARIRGIIDELRNDPYVSIVGLEIVGYASPEGSLANNKRLSEGRAMALRNYLASLYDFPMGIYKVSFGGENWDGLVRALEENPIEYGGEVLALIRNTNPDQTRKSRIMNMRGGAPYRYMLRNIYPGLRTAVCNIDYRIKGFGVEDAVEVFKTHPQNLSLNEFYMVANTFEEGSPEFIEVFETAVRLYPEDEIANLNAAVAAIGNGNIDLAERYLGRIQTKTNLPEYNNAMGAIAIVKKDYGSARAYFLRANEGLDAAARNLEMLSDIE